MDADYDSGVLCDGCAEKEGYAIGANGNLLCKACYLEFHEALNKTHLVKSSNSSGRLNLPKRLVGKHVKIKLVK